MQLFQLFSVSKVQGKICSNDGFADDLQNLLILTGAQSGEDIVPFQLWKSKKPIKSTSSNSEMIPVFSYQAGYNSVNSPMKTLVLYQLKHGMDFCIPCFKYWYGIAASTNQSQDLKHKYILNADSPNTVCLFLAWCA